MAQSRFDFDRDALTSVRSLKFGRRPVKGQVPLGLTIAAIFGFLPLLAPLGAITDRKLS